MSELRLDMDATTRAPSVARIELAKWLEEQDVADGRDDVVVVSSELVTNAVVHTHQGSTLVLQRLDGHVRIEVHDRDERGPVISETTGASGGFGLRLVEQLSDRWGWAPTPTGKVVWAEFDR